MRTELECRSSEEAVARSSRIRHCDKMHRLTGIPRGRYAAGFGTEAGRITGAEPFEMRPPAVGRLGALGDRAGDQLQSKSGSQSWPSGARRGFRVKSGRVTACHRYHQHLLLPISYIMSVKARRNAVPTDCFRPSLSRSDDGVKALIAPARHAGPHQRGAIRPSLVTQRSCRAGPGRPLRSAQQALGS